MCRLGGVAVSVDWLTNIVVMKEVIVSWRAALFACCLLYWAQVLFNYQLCPIPRVSDEGKHGGLGLTCRYTINSRRESIL